jgi:hypothetical protein
MRLTIDEYSKHFKMSKEMINSKLKAKKLNYIIENGVTYIVVLKRTQETTQAQTIQEENNVEKEKLTTQLTPPKQKTTVATVLALYQRENKQLKEKIIQLETKIDKLIDDKEQMLRDERDKIESLYSSKDEQLKNILELINTKLMLEKESQTIHEVESFNINEERVATKEDNSHIVELRQYLKTLDLKSYQRKIIKKRFLAVYDSDVRILQQNGKLYLDFSKYDYSDLLEY